MRKEMNYRQALRYLYSLTNYELKGLAAYAPEFYNLDRLRRFLNLLDNPHQKFAAVHIAGTKGKGSTSAMIESGLRAAGHRTGLFTSPHLHTFRERIQASGQFISEKDVARLAQKLRPLASEIADITSFEVMTGLAFAWFVEQGIEWGVLEVGLGGRLDATNVVTPAVSVITSISLDHTAILGDTLQKIAAEKAGIIKPGVPVVSAPQADEALAVIEEVSRQQDAPLTLVGRDWRWKAGQSNLKGQAFTLWEGQATWPELWLPLLGEHQLENAATAVATLSTLQAAGVEISKDAIQEGLRTICWPGRLEILAESPWLVVDSAHNGYSAEKLMAALRAHLEFSRLTVIVGVSSDHATPELMYALLSGADRAIATQTRHPRAASPAWLQERAAEGGFSMETSRTVPDALEMALADATPTDLICCTGSVFVAAEARFAWFVQQGLPEPPTDPV
jgi:dihydrofolate synthase / folylpolyglutamate synthase